MKLLPDGQHNLANIESEGGNVQVFIDPVNTPRERKLRDEIIRRVNAFDVLTATLRKAFEALRCDPVVCEVDGLCAACLAKLEVLAAIEAAEKGKGVEK